MEQKDFKDLLGIETLLTKPAELKITEVKLLQFYMTT